MRLEKIPEAEFKKTVLGIIGKHLNLNEYKVFIFGSRVEDKGDDRSDIDLGIEGPSQIDNTALRRVKEEMENLPTLYSIDVVDFSNVSDEFKKVAKTREYLN